MNRFLFSIFGASLLALGAIGCAAQPHIADLQTKPGNYEAKTVSLTVRVTEIRDIPLVTRDYYKVTDDTGELWVRTERGVPVSGLRYRISGSLVRSEGLIEGLFRGDHVLEEASREEVAP